MINTKRTAKDIYNANSCNADVIQEGKPLLQSVKSFLPSFGCYALKRLRVAFSELEEHKHICREFTRNTSAVFTTGQSESEIQFKVVPGLLISPDSELNSEAYRISIHQAQITVEAPTVTGVWRAMVFLMTLINQSQTSMLPCGRIEDWPSIALRGIHLDLTFVMYTPDFLMQLLPLFSAMSINTILLDISDKIQLPGYEFLAHPDALPQSFWREFEVEAKRWFIQIIPCVQTFGHMGNYLKHEECKHLRETTESKDVICPSNKKSLSFLRALLKGVRSAFPLCSTMHAGLDEVAYSGSCPHCRRHYTDAGYSGMFVRHVKAVHKMIRQENASMMMWADMLIAYPAIGMEIPKDILIDDWSYFRYRQQEETWFVFAGLRTEDMQAAGDRNDLKKKFPRDLFPIYEKFIWHDKSKKSFKPYPYTQYFLKEGFQVVGSPAIKCFGSHFVIPTYEKRLNNVISFTRELISMKALGVITTNWSPRGTHFFACSLPGYWAGALTAWTGRCPDNLLNAYLSIWMLPNVQTLLDDLRCGGAELSTLSNYEWSDDPEHFAKIEEDKFYRLSEKLSSKPAREKEKRLNELRLMEEAMNRLARKQSNSKSSRWIRSQIQFAAEIVLLKIQEEKLLLSDRPTRSAVHRFISNMRKSQLRVRGVFSNSLAKYSRLALRRVLFDGSINYWCD